MEKNGEDESTSSSSSPGMENRRRSTRIRNRQQSAEERRREEEGRKRQKLNWEEPVANYVVSRNDLFVNLSAAKIKFEGDEWDYENSGASEVKREEEEGESEAFMSRGVGGNGEDWIGSLPYCPLDGVRMEGVSDAVYVENDDQWSLEETGQEWNPGSEVDADNLAIANHLPPAVIDSVALQSLQEENEELKRILQQRNVETRVLAEKIELLEFHLSLSTAIDRRSSSSVEQSSSSRDQGGACNNCEKYERRPQVKDDKPIDLRVRGSVPTKSRKQVPVSELAQDLGTRFNPVKKAFGDQRALLLFDEVLKILIQRGSRIFGSNHWRKPGQFLLSCRLVCKSWKRSVDALLENHPPHVAADWTGVQYSFGHGVLKFKAEAVDCDSDRISRFTKMFRKQQARNPSYNPIPTRHLEINLVSSRCTRQWVNFSQDVSDYLQAFGSQVWYLTLIGRAGISKPQQQDVIQILKNISSWLHLIPNLKSLAVDVSSGFIHGLPLEPKVKLEKDIFKVPHFKHLIAFQAKHDSLLVSNVLKENGHIQKLGLPLYSGPAHAIMKSDLQNLSELSVILDSPQQLQQLGSASWKLQKLSLRVSGTENCLLTDVMTALSKFKDSLQSLSLDVSSYYMHGRLGKSPLPLPCLKHLRIKFKDYTVIFWGRFLKELKHVESLKIELVQDIRRSDFLNCDIKRETFWKNIDVVHEANYWTSFPNLRSVDLNVKVEWCGQSERLQHFVKRKNMPVLKFDIVKVFK